MFDLCYAVLSVPCSRVIICWERTELLADLCFITFRFGVPRKVWYLLVSILDRSLPLYFNPKSIVLRVFDVNLLLICDKSFALKFCFAYIHM